MKDRRKPAFRQASVCQRAGKTSIGMQCFAYFMKNDKLKISELTVEVHSFSFVNDIGFDAKKTQR